MAKSDGSGPDDVSSEEAGLESEWPAVEGRRIGFEVDGVEYEETVYFIEDPSLLKDVLLAADAFNSTANDMPGTVHLDGVVKVLSHAACGFYKEAAATRSQDFARKFTASICRRVLSATLRDAAQRVDPDLVCDDVGDVEMFYAGMAEVYVHLFAMSVAAEKKRKGSGEPIEKVLAALPEKLGESGHDWETLRSIVAAALERIDSTETLK
jgi:hypothetical protein